MQGGRYHLCPDLVFLATPPYDGALMELMAIDARNLYPFHPEMTYEQGACSNRSPWASGAASERT